MIFQKNVLKTQKTQQNNVLYLHQKYEQNMNKSKIKLKNDQKSIIILINTNKDYKIKLIALRKNQKEMNKAKKRTNLFSNRSLSMNEDINHCFKKQYDQNGGEVINEEEDEDNCQEGVSRRAKQPQMGIFEQFKIKYDQLRKQNEQKRKEVQDLKRVNKRYQIQLLNINTQFYDREVKRLRGEVERLQSQVEDYKHKYFERENQNKSIKASLTINEAEMKKLIKQLEKQKITNIQHKHEHREKQKQYIRIMEELQKNNSAIGEKYLQSQSKLNFSQIKLHQLQRKQEQTQLMTTKLQCQCKELKEESKLKEEKYTEMVQALKASSEQFEYMCRQQKQIIAKTNYQYEELLREHQKKKAIQIEQSLKAIDKVNKFRTLRVLQMENKRLVEEKNQIQGNLKSSQVKLKTKLKECNQLSVNFSQQTTELKQQINQRQNIILQMKRQYTSEILALTKKLELLEFQLSSQLYQSKVNHLSSSIQNTKNCPNNSIQTQRQHHQLPLSVKRNHVDNVISNDLYDQFSYSRLESQNLQLKHQLTTKIDQIYAIKQLLQQAQIKCRHYENELHIVNTKLQVQIKNHRKEVLLINEQNQANVKLLQMKIQVLEQKLQIKGKEIKEKDQFIVNYIVGKMNSNSDNSRENVSLMVDEIHRVFEMNYLERLQEAERKIKNASEKQIEN